MQGKNSSEGWNLKSCLAHSLDKTSVAKGSLQEETSTLFTVKETLSLFSLHQGTGLCTIPSNSSQCDQMNIIVILKVTNIGLQEI